MRCSSCPRMDSITTNAPNGSGRGGRAAISGATRDGNTTAVLCLPRDGVVHSPSVPSPSPLFRYDP